MKAKFPDRSGEKMAFLSILLAAALGLSITRLDAEVAFSAGLEIQSVSDFYTPLTSCGTWYSMPAYGRCWHPAAVAAVWRPYSVGHWEWTDCGWYWMSDEPWA